MNDYHDRELDCNDLIAAARVLWGKETSRTRTEWRFGTKGSKSIDLDDLVWFDHEAGKGGGIIELCGQAGINGHFAGDKPPARAVNSGNSGDSGDKWEPRIPSAEAPINKTSCDHLYVYRDVDGNVTHYVRRWYPKKIRPLTWGVLDGKLDWHPKAPRPPLPLYKIEDIRELDPELILLCEGEKACDAANHKITAEGLPWLALS